MKEENKMPLAAAIKYDKDDVAPTVTAKGRGLVAEKIIALARKHDVPIKSDPALVQILSKLEIDSHIPVELYRAVAEVLAFVYAMNTAWREKKDR